MNLSEYISADDGLLDESLEEDGLGPKFVPKLGLVSDPSPLAPPSLAAYPASSLLLEGLGGTERLPEPRPRLDDGEGWLRGRGDLPEGVVGAEKKPREALAWGERGGVDVGVDVGGGVGRWFSCWWVLGVPEVGVPDQKELICREDVGRKEKEKRNTK